MHFIKLRIMVLCSRRFIQMMIYLRLMGLNQERLELLKLLNGLTMMRV